MSDLPKGMTRKGEVSRESSEKDGPGSIRNKKSLIEGLGPKEKASPRSIGERRRPGVESRKDFKV
jgi:hypothetical protein